MYYVLLVKNEQQQQQLFGKLADADSVLYFDDPKNSFYALAVAASIQQVLLLFLGLWHEYLIRP